MWSPERSENVGLKQHVSPHGIFFFSLSAQLILQGVPVETCEQWLLVCTCIAVLFLEELWLLGVCQSVG